MHRLLFRRHRLQTLVAAAHRCAYGGLLLLGVALAGVTTLVFDAVADRNVAIAAGACALAAFALFWVVLPLAMRGTDRPDSPSESSQRGAAAIQRMVELREKFQWILENLCCARTFQFLAADPAAEQADARHLCAGAGLGIPHRVTDEHRLLRRSPAPDPGRPATMSGSGLAVSTSPDDVTSEITSSQSRTLRRIASSSSGADVASTTCRPSVGHPVQEFPRARQWPQQVAISR